MKRWIKPLRLAL